MRNWALLELFDDRATMMIVLRIGGVAINKNRTAVAFMF